jgi:A/G-specific adenine glycosylase
LQALIAPRLLAWYAVHKRILPWRDNPDPYAVWVSEIMLQQTRVEAVLPYFKRWMALFPSIHTLANASQQEVLSIWEGLGYYSRARNLHRAAQMVLEEYDGQLPQDPETLRKLPGIGPYTAGAIASIAFNQDVAALDGNIRRVYARLFDVREPINTGAAERRLDSIAVEHLPEGAAGDYNQALMDLGATICTPTKPRCAQCPVHDLCHSFALGVQEDRPVRNPKPASPHHNVTAAVIRDGKRILIAQRPQDGLLGGMWEFPGGKLQPGEDIIAGLKREIREELGVEIRVSGPLGVYRHAYTHFRLTLYAYGCELVEGRPHPLEVDDLRWVTVEELSEYPMGKIDREISHRLLQGSQN